MVVFDKRKGKELRQKGKDKRLGMQDTGYRIQDKRQKGTRKIA